MASYHLSVKSVRRSEGRSATAAAAYRHAERIACEREGRVHDYRAKAGVEASILVLPAHAPAWAVDRAALWNAAEARETRVNSVTAREWELALPHELGAEGRRALVEGFARELVTRYGVAADVAIHAPHREGDQRNWHAHVLTTTRVLTAEGLADKTRVLDAKQTGGHEVEHMRGRWAEMQNHALERAHVAERVDHRTLAVQRDEARALGHEARADNLDRAPEVKLGPVVSAVERREQRAAERDGHDYVPVTERGAQVHEARAARSLLAELARLREALHEEVRQRAELARETYAHARGEGTDRIRAGLAALRAAAQRQGIGLDEARGSARSLARGLAHGPAPDDERGREAGRDPWQERQASRDSIKERLGRIRAREAPHHAQDGVQHGPAAGLSAHGPGSQNRQDRPERQRSLGAEAIREELRRLRERAQPAAQREHEEPAAGLPAHGQGRGREHEQAQEEHQAQRLDAVREQLRGALDRARPVALDREELGHEPDPINARLRAMLARERSAVQERPDPLALVAERLRDEAPYAAAFATPEEAREFREEMERRFDPGTLQRLGRGEQAALAQVAGSPLDGLCLARAYLDSHGEPEHSDRRLSLMDAIIDVQVAAQRERHGHEEDGHDWGL